MSIQTSFYASLALLSAAVMVVTWAQPSRAHEPASKEIVELSRRLEQAPRAVDLVKRGELYRVEGHYDAALADFTHAERLDPSLREVHICRGALYVDAGRPLEALAEIDTFLASEPEHAAARRLRAQALLALRRVHEAVAEFDRAIELTPRPNPDHYYERAQILAGCGDDSVEVALRGLDEGMHRLGPVVSLASLAIDLEMKLGQHRAALQRLEAMALQFGRQEAVLERRARILIDAGWFEEARGALIAALAEIEAQPKRRRETRATKELESRVRKSLAELMKDRE